MARAVLGRWRRAGGGPRARSGDSEPRLERSVFPSRALLLLAKQSPAELRLRNRLGEKTPPLIPLAFILFYFKSFVCGAKNIYIEGIFGWIFLTFLIIYFLGG